MVVYLSLGGEMKKKTKKQNKKQARSLGRRREDCPNIQGVAIPCGNCFWFVVIEPWLPLRGTMLEAFKYSVQTD